MKYKNLNILVYDFDGVMTNNKVYIDKFGNEIVQVNRSDGLAINKINELGIKQIILSTEKDTVVSQRAKKLKLLCLQNVYNKKTTLIEFCESNNYDLENVGYVGNDINDEDVMRIVGITFCPSDSHVKIKKISQNILRTKGGDGVIRELYDLLLLT